MKYALTAGLIGIGLVTAAPAFAQGVYVGPGGVGIDTGIRRHHDYYGDRDRDYDRGPRPYYEGRSVYHDHDRYDRY